MRYWMALLAWSWASWAMALLFEPPVDDATWHLEASVFECRLWQEVPDYGRGVFYHRAGEKLTFYLDPILDPMADRGVAAVLIKQPTYKNWEAPAQLDRVLVGRSEEYPFLLSERTSQQLLVGLRRGMWPTFNQDARHDPSELVSVSLSSMNFGGFYRKFIGCQAQLLPVNFDQIQRTIVLFDTDKWDIKSAYQQTLAHIVTYVSADPSVDGFFIDGHTDSRASEIHNIELSEKRAKAVTEFLVQRGISADNITMRYHGERYPTASNKSKSGRLRNRRVTLRLERTGQGL